MGNCCASRDKAENSNFGPPPAKQGLLLDYTMPVRANNSRYLDFKSHRGFHKVNNIEQIYQLERVLGAGQFGKVWQATHKKAQIQCALKVIQKTMLEEREIYATLMKQELTVLEQINHPYVVRVIDLFEDKRNIYVALELLPSGNLLEVLHEIQKRRASFTERDAAHLIWQILMAVSYIHEAGLIHRDLKMENIMVEMVANDQEQTEMVCKLTDFGFACVIEPGADLQLTLGTPLYMAPEIVKGETYGQKVDIWAVGVIAYSMLTSNFPYDGLNRKIIYQKVASKKEQPVYNSLEKYWQDGALVIDFIKKCLEKDPSKRWSAKQLLSHEWLRIMVNEESLSSEQLTTVGISLYTFKRTSQFQSFIISFLVGLKAQNDELNRVRAIFQQIDADKNGFLDRGEIIQAMSQVRSDLQRFLGVEPNWDDLINVLDVNGDGRISYEEFTLAAYNRRKLLNDENLKTAFDLLDQDGDGKISREEISRCLATSTLDNLAMHDINMPEQTWSELISDCDVNGDGLIEYAEFHHYLTGHLEKQLKLTSQVNVEGLTTQPE